MPSYKNRATVLSVYLLLLQEYVGNAFVTPLSNNHKRILATRRRAASRIVSSTRLYDRMSPYDHDGGFDYFDDNNGESFDIEATRERLEALVGGGTTSPSKVPERGGNAFAASFSSAEEYLDHHMDDDEYEIPTSLENLVLPKAQPLTTIERERRHAEIELLSQLVDGDDSIPDLWNLWFNERGAKASERLMKADELTSQGPSGWQEAEHVLRQLIEEYGIYWAEPVNRLATLCYLQGRLEESEMLCKMVISIKPWHFGAISGLVMVYASLSDSEQARKWAASRLPTYAPTGPNRRRVAWVQKAVQRSAESLLAAEENLQDSFFGEADFHAIQSNNNVKRRRLNKKKNRQQQDQNHFQNIEDEEDAWQ